ncbi:MAG: DMT family transporter [Campylobacterota bacterium]|nr:DMT family transporter [Campylobacterota bacterium]
MPVAVLLVLCVLFWSGNFIIGRYVSGGIDPVQLAMFRWLGAALLMSPLLFRSYRKIFQALKSDFIIINVLAILGITMFNTLLYIGLQETTATNALLINSSVPIAILVLSFLILKVPIVLKQLIGILLSTFGVVFLIVKGELLSLHDVQFSHGDFWVVAASSSWALYSVLVRFKPKNLSDFEFFTTIVFVGLFWLSIVYFLMGYSLSEDIVLVKVYYPAFIYISLFTSVLSYYFWHQGIAQIGANKTGQFTHLMPLFGAILAYVFLGETLSFYHIVGAVFIGIGIYLSLFSPTHT